MVTISDLVDLFISDRLTYCAAASIKYYREDLRKFVSFLSSRGVFDPRDITKVQLQQYAIYLRDTRRIKATSIHTYFRAVYAFLSWLVEEEYIMEYKRIKLPKQNPETVLPLTTEEVRKILRVIELRSADADRDTLIIRLMLDCGMRSSEVRNLRVRDIDFQKRVIHIRDSKYNKSRVLPLPAKIDDLFYWYFMDREPKKDDWALPSSSGEQLTENALKQFFSKLKRRSQIERVHAHLLRHTFATSYMCSHNNIEYLRIYMGHSSYQVTQTYVHLASQCLLTRYDVYRIPECFV